MVASPVGTGLTLGRTDQGVDWSGSGPLYAVGSGTIINLYNSGWPGGTFIVLKLDQAAGLPSQLVYYAEDITPSVQIGQHVNEGAVIGQATGGSSGIEIGWANPAAIGSALAASQFTGSNATQLGQDFKNWIGGAVAAVSGMTQGQAFTQAASAGSAFGLTANEVIAYAFFLSKGLSSAASAGIVGNLMQESGVNPESPGGGIAQWIGSRAGNAVQTGNVQSDLLAQLNNLWTELSTQYSGTLSALQQPGIAPNWAAWVFANQYERCAQCGNANSGDVNNRVSNANKVAQLGDPTLASSGPLGPIGGFINGIVSWLSGNPEAAPGSVGAVGSALNTWSTVAGDIGRFFGDVFSPNFWTRIGLFALGGALTIGGLILFASQTKEGQRIISEGSQAAGEAGMAAAMA